MGLASCADALCRRKEGNEEFTGGAQVTEVMLRLDFKNTKMHCIEISGPGLYLCRRPPTLLALVYLFYFPWMHTYTWVSLFDAYLKTRL
jgi:hypothetical protein